MKNITTILIAIFSILIFGTCTKIDYDALKYKDRKENHRLFRCKYNGEEWTTRVEYSLLGMYNPPQLESTFYKGYKGKDFLEIKARHYNENNNDYQIINIYYSDILKPGINKLTNYDDEFIYERGIGKHFFLDPQFDNFLDISDIDTINHIIKGTFQFKADDKEKRHSAEITDGEFDIKIRFWRPEPHHIFRCIINHKVWSPSQYYKESSTIHGYYSNKNKSFSISAAKYYDLIHSEEISLKFDCDLEPSTIQLSNYDKPVFISDLKNYYLDSTFNNIINITKVDTTKKYIIGNVEFRAICDECPSNDTIRLTNGYFDVKYY